jgi:microtubule-associated protein tau
MKPSIKWWPDLCVSSQILSNKLSWTAKSKIGSLDNTSHKPGGGDKRIESIKTDFKDKAKSRVGSKDNIKHQPGGGDVKVTTVSLEQSIFTLFLATIIY